MFILKSVSKKTTHTGPSAREAFSWFFPPPYSVKFIFYGVYCIIKSPRGTRQRIHRGTRKIQSVFLPCYTVSVRGTRQRLLTVYLEWLVTTSHDSNTEYIPSGIRVPMGIGVSITIEPPTLNNRDMPCLR